ADRKGQPHRVVGDLRHHAEDRENAGAHHPADADGNRRRHSDLAGSSGAALRLCRAGGHYCTRESILWRSGIVVYENYEAGGIRLAATRVAIVGFSVRLDECGARWFEFEAFRTNRAQSCVIFATLSVSF